MGFYLYICVTYILSHKRKDAIFSITLYNLVPHFKYIQ
nr:hypothetical protein [Gloeochaete wittrockiana]